MTERRAELRAADTDREYAADRLRLALDEGRLTLGEYDERLQDAYAARTYGELDRLLADLPGVVPPSRAALAPLPPPTTSAVTPSAVTTPASVSASAPVGRRGGPVPVWLAGVWSAWLVAVLVNVAIWGAVSLSDGLVYFWPIWVAGPWGAVLLAVTISGLLRGEPHRRAGRSRD